MVTSPLTGDTDISSVSGALADPGRARMLLALGDGRALAASTLAAEAGIAPSTASAHLAKLVAAGLFKTERHGRHRYYRMAGPEVGELLEALARVAPPAPVHSLREGSRAHAVRSARTCYDHLAGQLGTGVMAALLERGVLAGGDGAFHPDAGDRDHLSGPGWDYDYHLTATGRAWMDDFGVKVATGTRRPLVRYCVDWSEQRHHLAGALGAALLGSLLDKDWVRRSPTSRAVHVTEEGRDGFASAFGLKAARVEGSSG
jgi:DNA-binding transcriptional ArsR family regulator